MRRLVIAMLVGLAWAPVPAGTADLQVLDSALDKRLAGSGLKDMDTAVVAGLRADIRF